MPLEPLGPGWESLLAHALEKLPPGRWQPDRPGSRDWVDVVARYLDEVVTWNRKTDLTAARTAEELVDLTIGDALPLAAASEDTGEWIDVGSGAGAPGLVLAWMLPSVRMTLVEPRDRRVAFLRSMIGKLGSTRIVVSRGRSEGLPDGGWEVAVSRATLPPAEWLEEGARLASRAVWVLLARGDPPALAGWREDASITYEWPLTGALRRAVRYVRVSPMTR